MVMRLGTGWVKCEWVYAATDMKKNTPSQVTTCNDSKYGNKLDYLTGWQVDRSANRGVLG
jgi:hypothetical protein